MQVFLNRVDGIDDAVISMFLSKRTLTRELETEIREEMYNCSNMSYTENGILGSLRDTQTEKMTD